jgi:anhydro-N-acetylmuramic acid kinase
MISQSEWLSVPRVVAGAMSGTSLDGVDAAIVRLSPSQGRTHIEILGTASVEFPRLYRRALLSMIEEPFRISELGMQSCVLMHIYERAIEEAIVQANVLPEAIGIHGQTLWHAPTPTTWGDISCRSSFQLATPAILASVFGVPAISDVRSADIALGGQGAPLVPILDWELLRDDHHFTIALNIGGIANITVLPPGVPLGDVRAFDTGPGNVWIDMAMHRYWGKQFDEGGATAAAGTIVSPLFEQLKTVPFITMPPPKSTGRELFSAETLVKFLAPYERGMVCAEDIIATLTAFTAWSIAENIRRFAQESARVVISGGGSKNATLVEYLRRELPKAQLLLLSDCCRIPESAKEAVLMALIAYRTLGGLPSSIPSVTGARRAAVLGSITPPP